MRREWVTAATDDFSTGARLRRLAARQMVPFGLSLVLIWLMWHHLGGVDLPGIGAGFRQASPVQWSLAVMFTAVSFWAVGRYDAVVHRLANTGIGPRAALTGGAASIAVAQSVGFGVVSSALIRWRLLPGLSLVQSLRIAIIVSLSFLGAWAVVCASVVLLAAPGDGMSAAAGIVLTGAGGFACLSLWRPGPLARLALPPLAAMAAFLALALIDTVAAGLALYVLLPVHAAPPFLPFLAAFLVALGAGLVSGTPGGMGVFELTLLALLPSVAEAPLLGAILAFRVVYYALPALIGAGIAIAGPRGDRAPGQTVALRQPDHAAIARLSHKAKRAETALLHQRRLRLSSWGAMAGLTPQCLVQLSDPLSPRADHGDVVAQLGRAARALGRSPAIYKGGARLAVAARRQGWHVLTVAREAWLDPRGYAPEGKAFRQLRRKLRKAEQSGVTVEAADPAALPGADLADIARDWARARGGERGWSMGVFDPAALRFARVFLVRQRGGLIGVLTLHANAREWTLDLMRYRTGAPDGAMHLALHHAILVAAAEGMPRLSLAAVPAGRIDGEPPVVRHLRTWLDRASGAQGLRQFKNCFAPRWEMLYFAAPTRTGLVLAALDIARAIARRR